jgi:solute carrier family 50 (sugar transporter)
MSSWSDVFFAYVCPTLGGLVASTLFAAPIHDLRTALQNETLGPLNPNPWAVMSGNCLGWCIYSYYTNDPFILAANLPGLLLSLWLNIGAAKLQYLAQVESIRVGGSSSSKSGAAVLTTNPLRHRHRHPFSHGEVDTTGAGHINAAVVVSKENLVHSPQDVLLLRILCVWGAVLVAVGWLGVVPPGPMQAQTVGLIVNVNLIFFYAAPLQTMRTVLEHKCSDSLHTMTILLNCLNATFWMLYGIALDSPVVYGPNGIGLALGTAQLVLLIVYPKSGHGGRRYGRPSNLDGDDDGPSALCESEFGTVVVVHDADPADSDDEPELDHPTPPTTM